MPTSKLAQHTGQKQLVSSKAPANAFATRSDDDGEDAAGSRLAQLLVLLVCRAGHQLVSHES